MKLNDVLEEVEEGSHVRMSCPNCRSNNSLSVTHSMGVIQWFCFDANCGTRGSRRTVPLLDGLRKRLEARTEANSEFEVPAYWIMGISSKKCVSLLNRTNSLEPYRKGYFKVAYDPRQDRLVYLIQDNHKIVGGIGRTLSGQQPKTLIYPGSHAVPLRVGKGRTLVLTEDCASACSISNFPAFTGSPLLGTNIKEEYLRYYRHYDKLIIALDPDAKKKALQHQRFLTYHHPHVSVWYAPKDFKDMTNDQIQEFLDDNKGY